MDSHLNDAANLDDGFEIKTGVVFSLAMLAGIVAVFNCVSKNKDGASNEDPIYGEGVEHGQYREHRTDGYLAASKNAGIPPQTQNLPKSEGDHPHLDKTPTAIDIERTQVGSAMYAKVKKPATQISDDNSLAQPHSLQCDNVDKEARGNQEPDNSTHLKRDPTYYVLDRKADVRVPPKRPPPTLEVDVTGEKVSPESDKRPVSYENVSDPLSKCHGFVSDYRKGNHLNDVNGRQTGPNMLNLTQDGYKPGRKNRKRSSDYEITLAEYQHENNEKRKETEADNVSCDIDEYTSEDDGDYGHLVELEVAPASPDGIYDKLKSDFKKAML